MSEIIVDHIKIDKDNPVFFQAADFVMYDGPRDYDIIFLTGKAGTGKTTFLKYIKNQYKGNVVVLAFTGVAAINAGGQTIHSFFHLQLGPYMPQDERLNHEKIYEHLQLDSKKVELIRKMDLLVIDEVSMLRCDLLDAINVILKTYRRNDSPFGGVKVLLIGDVFQLPPVITDDDGSREIISHFYPSGHFFSSFAYKSAKCVFFELDKTYRQSELDFMKALDNIRAGVVRTTDLQLLNSHVDEPKDDEQYIYLASTNNVVNHYNQTQFDSINQPIVSFHGIIEGEFKMSMVNVDQDIDLKVGAQVMTMRNKYADSSGDFLYYNGSIGTITEIDPNAQWVKVRLSGSSNEVTVTQEVWENIEYTWDFEKQKCTSVVVGTFTQIPIRLAWAITIHKSQGLSFDSVKADFSNVSFTHGLVYVALSRCRKLCGLHLTSQLSVGQIRVDPLAIEFAKTKTTDIELQHLIDTRQADLLYAQCRDAFRKGDTRTFLTKLDEAFGLRNEMLSDGFERYINIYMEKYRNYQKMAAQLKVVSNQLEEAKLEEKTLSANLQDSKDTIGVIDKQLQHQNHTIEQLQTKVSDLSVNVGRQKALIEEQEKEINRLRNLPWWKSLLKRR